MEITDKERLNFLNENKRFGIKFDARIRKFKVFGVNFDTDQFKGSTIRSAIDNAIMAMREKCNV